MCRAFSSCLDGMIITGNAWQHVILNQSNPLNFIDFSPFDGSAWHAWAWWCKFAHFFAFYSIIWHVSWMFFLAGFLSFFFKFIAQQYQISPAVASLSGGKSMKNVFYCLSRAQRGESILSQLCWWKICLSRSAQWDKVIESEPAIHACYATQGTCLSRLVALPWISKDISLHHCATDVRLYVWPYRIFLVTQTTNRVLGSSFLAKRSLCSLVCILVSETCHFCVLGQTSSIKVLPRFIGLEFLYISVEVKSYFG